MYALARYSRSGRFHPPVDRLGALAQFCRNFLGDSFYFQYGHQSIADLGYTVVPGFEGISELAASEIEDETLWDGQAKSSRYQDFSKSGFITPPELDGEVRRHSTGVRANRCSAHTRMFTRGSGII